MASEDAKWTPKTNWTTIFKQTFHPGQYNQLASPNKDVVRRTIADLQCNQTSTTCLYRLMCKKNLRPFHSRSCRNAQSDEASTGFHYDHVSLNKLQVASGERMNDSELTFGIRHMGGTYGDKPSALDVSEQVYY
jgi:hypothetical protein